MQTLLCYCCSSLQVHALYLLVEHPLDVWLADVIEHIFILHSRLVPEPSQSIRPDYLLTDWQGSSVAEVAVDHISEHCLVKPLKRVKWQAQPLQDCHCHCVSCIDDFASPLSREAQLEQAFAASVIVCFLQELSEPHSVLYWVLPHLHPSSIL